MITDDEAHEVLAALEEFKRAPSRVAQEFMHDSGASMRGSDES
jgi:hypothetical protein